MSKDTLLNICANSILHVEELVIIVRTVDGCFIETLHRKVFITVHFRFTKRWLNFVTLICYFSKHYLIMKLHGLLALLLECSDDVSAVRPKKVLKFKVGVTFSQIM